MKIKSYILSLIAVLAMMASCSEDFEPTYLDEIKVSSSYVSIPEAGGSTTIELTTTGDYTITGMPEWLTVTPTAGAAGTSTVTFSAEANVGGRSTEDVRIKVGEVEQNINVLQGLSTVSNATCAEVIAGPDAKTYRVKGVVTAIANTTYGNFYLNDGTGEIYVYGTLYAGKTKNDPIKNNNIEVGDEVTVEGPKTTYGSTIELVDVTVVEVSKSLIKVDSLMVGDVVTSTLPKEGGEVTAYITCKGEGVNVDTPVDWLSIKSIKSEGTNAEVTFKVDANAAGARSTEVTFVTYLDGKSYTSTTAITQEGAIVELPVADFLTAEEGQAQYRLTGAITSITRADRGRFTITDYSGSVYVYNQADFEANGLKLGDIITFVGERSSYQGTPQVANSVYESHISVTAATIAEALAAADDNDKYYMVTGTIESIANENYGNLTLTDGTNSIYVYGTYPGYGATGSARQGAIAQYGLKVGDTLTVIAPKTTYRGTPQLQNSFYYSHVSN